MLRKIANAILLALNLSLTACALTPEQQAARIAAQQRQQQALQVHLASQCDADTAQRTSQARLNWAGCLTAKFPLATATQAV